MNVSAHTSIYFVIKNLDISKSKALEVTLIEEMKSLHVLNDQKFLNGFDGRFINATVDKTIATAVYIEPKQPLKENTRYTVQVYVTEGATTKRDQWSFTTAPHIPDTPVSMSVDFNTHSVQWHGQLFAGIIKPNYNTSKMFHQLDSYKMMQEVSRKYPTVWSLQRDYSLTEDFWFNGVWDGNPNLVREKETRQIKHVSDTDNLTILTIEDFYGHLQYGIESNRPPSADYKKDDTILIADRAKSETAQIVHVNDKDNTITITKLKHPANSWVLDYPGSTPIDFPETPGHFGLPRCYLRKFKPSGTPVYFWDRINAEMDLIHKEFGRRLVVNFASVPVDLSSNGLPGHPGGNGSHSKPKDYLQYRNFIYTVIDHVIKRYGHAALDFYYSVGNEFDLNVYWSDTQQEAHKLYDYTVDAILKAFEGNNLDSSKVMVGGLEFATIWGLSTVPEFLYHCSPTAKIQGKPEINTNYAYADPALDGKRSKRVDSLCKTNNGKGSPCDYISIHQYTKSNAMAESIIKAKELALKIDAAFYEKLYVNSFECCPGWYPLPDPAQRAIYKGNGYFPAWTANVIQKLIAKACQDKKYAFGETLFTVWPVDYNCGGMTSVTALFMIDDNDDKKMDRILTVKKPIFNFIELFGMMSHDYFAIPDTKVCGNVISGFGSKKENSRQLMLYCHNENDIETRTDRGFQIKLEMKNIPWGEVTVEQFKIDKHNNSVFPAVMKLSKKDFYKEQEILHLTELDDLKPFSIVKQSIQENTLVLDLTIATNGITFLNIMQK